MITRTQLVRPVAGENCNKGVNTRAKVTVHETANTSPGADAASHANLQSRGNSREASWHWTVDDTEAVQSFNHSVRCWHASTTTGNNTSIGVEICVNSDGNFILAVRNAAELVANILRTEGLTLHDVVQHNYWSGKNCPTNLRSGRIVSWGQFLALVETFLYGGSSPEPPAPLPVPTPPVEVDPVISIIRRVDDGLIQYLTAGGVIETAADVQEVYAMAKALGHPEQPWINLDSFEHTRVHQAAARIRAASLPPVPTPES